MFYLRGGGVTRPRVRGVLSTIATPGAFYGRTGLPGIEVKIFHPCDAERHLGWKLFVRGIIFTLATPGAIWGKTCGVGVEWRCRWCWFVEGLDLSAKVGSQSWSVGWLVIGRHFSRQCSSLVGICRVSWCASAALCLPLSGAFVSFLTS